MGLLMVILRIGVILIAGYVVVQSVRWTRHHARTALHVARTPTGLDTYSSGTIAATGTARPTDKYGTLHAPVTGTQCLAYTYRVSRDTVGDVSDIVPKQQGSDAVPFTLDSPTGTALVHPVERDAAGHPTDNWQEQTLPGLECPTEYEENIYQLFGQEVPDHVSDMVPDAVDQNQEVYLHEERLEPSTDVYVLGMTRDSSPSSVETTAGIENRRDKPFTVTAGDQNATLWRYTAAAVGNAFFGLIAGVVAFVLATPVATLVLAR